MTDIWDDLRCLHLIQGDSDIVTADEKLDLLAQMVANLIDEVEILKQHAWMQSGLSHEEWMERYRKDRMWLLFSSQGSPSACVRKYQSYLKNRQEMAEELIPDQQERDEQINELGILT